MQGEITHSDHGLLVRTSRRNEIHIYFHGRDAILVPLNNTSGTDSSKDHFSRRIWNSTSPSREKRKPSTSIFNDLTSLKWTYQSPTAPFMGIYQGIYHCTCTHSPIILYGLPGPLSNPHRSDLATFDIRAPWPYVQDAKIPRTG